MTAGSGGLSSPVRLTFGPDGKLYVADFNTSSVLHYDGLTGAYLDTFVGGHYSGGLYGPGDLAFGSDGNLYVASFYSGRVLRYDGSSSAPIDTFVGVDSPVGIRFGLDGNLYVASFSSSQVLRYQGPSDAAPGHSWTSRFPGATSACTTPQRSRSTLTELCTSAVGEQVV